MYLVMKIMLWSMWRLIGSSRLKFTSVEEPDAQSILSERERYQFYLDDEAGQVKRPLTKP